MFLLHEKVVYPGYGVAIINRLVERLVIDKKTNFFELKFNSKDMTVLIPEERLESIGVRKLSSMDELVEMFAILQDFDSSDIITEHNASTWNKRNKEYQFKLRSGQLLHIASIYKELQLIGLDKELSFGERNLFNQIEFLLIEEVCAIDTQETPEQVRSKLRQSFEIMGKKLTLHTFSKGSFQSHMATGNSYKLVSTAASTGNKAQAVV